MIDNTCKCVPIDPEALLKFREAFLAEFERGIDYSQVSTVYQDDDLYARLMSDDGSVGA